MSPVDPSRPTPAVDSTPSSDAVLADARRILEEACHPPGILASVTDVTNYRRVWARDSVICGLGGLVDDNPTIIDGLERSLRSLASGQGPDGQIPSNVAMDESGQVAGYSLGGLSGRVDTNTWFVIGAGSLLISRPDRTLIEAFREPVTRALGILDAWEFNRRGLVHVPQGGNWADEYVVRGYTFYDQVLRIWALRLAVRSGLLDEAPRLDALTRRVEDTYWVEAGSEPGADPYHPVARQAIADSGGRPFWMASLHPGGYQDFFDAFGNALAVLLGLGAPDHRRQALDHGQSLVDASVSGMVPAFWPIIEPGDAAWDELTLQYRDVFSNRPGRYHNGGVWPMVNGWWGIALLADGRREAFEALARAVEVFVSREDRGFHEYGEWGTGRPGGTRVCAWSAAAILALSAAGRGSGLWWGRDDQEAPA